MISLTTDPITTDWTNEPLIVDPLPATAADVNGLLARLEVADLDAHLVPYLAAAAAELALLSGVGWRFSGDDPPVALLRIIAKVATSDPSVGGPHTLRLFDQLRSACETSSQ